MTLDSSDSLPIAGGTHQIGQVVPTRSKGGMYPEPDSWCYLFTHWTKVPALLRGTDLHFRCFIHETTYKYARSRKECGEIRKPTISGLVFIQGPPRAIQTHLRQFFPDLHLTRDCTTGQTAVIPDAVMQPFMRIAEHDPTRLRILRHPLDYYAQGHVPVRFTSGLLKGCEGYIIRMDRDRKLVMQMGNMTLAVGNIQREQFENIEEAALPEEIKERLK
ncbi:MAG: hypothetical protein NC388_07550 [Clostridium sp.]|nr:hypothetical protein [Clostridium sp.]